MNYCRVILVILAAVFVSQNGASVSPVLSNFNATVQKTVDALGLRKIHVAEKGNEKFAIFLDNLKQEVVKSVNETRGDFDAKDPQCRAALEKELNTAENKVISQLEKCVQQHTPKWGTIEESIDGLISRGNQILAKMNEIEGECASDKEALARICIAMKIPKVAVSVGTYLGAVGKMEGKIGVSIGLGFAGAAKCIHSPMIKFYSDIGKAKDNAMSCTEYSSESSQEDVY